MMPVALGAKPTLRKVRTLRRMARIVYGIYVGQLQSSQVNVPAGERRGTKVGLLPASLPAQVCAVPSGLGFGQGRSELGIGHASVHLSRNYFVRSPRLHAGWVGASAWLLPIGVPDSSGSWLLIMSGLNSVLRRRKLADRAAGVSPLAGGNGLECLGGASSYDVSGRFTGL